VRHSSARRRCSHHRRIFECAAAVAAEASARPTLPDVQATVAVMVVAATLAAATEVATVAAATVAATTVAVMVVAARAAAARAVEGLALGTS
jgi:hypothetical protein